MDNDYNQFVEEADRALDRRDGTNLLPVIADVWQSYLGLRPESVDLTYRDVAAMMVLLKMVRQANKDDDDNWVDTIGYARLAE